MASIKMRKKKDGSRVFDIRIMVDGTMYRRSYPEKNEDPIPSSWSDKKAGNEAIKAAARFEDECKHGLVSNDKRSFSEYSRYVLDLKETSKALKPSTLDGYRAIIHRIDEASLGKKKVRDITVRDLNEFYNYLAECSNLKTGKPLSARTIRIYHALISSVLRHAAKEELIPFNPAQNATLPMTERKEANSYTPDKISQILAALESEPIMWKAITYLFIGTGMRRGELSGLRWSDIDFKERIIRIQRNVTRQTKKGLVIGTPKTGRERSVSVEPEVINVLLDWKKVQSESFRAIPLDGYCFACTDPQIPIDPDSISTYYQRFSKRHDLGKINSHAFRHTQASIILSDGDIIMASRRLGHSRASTTMDTYGHMMPQADREASAKVGDILFRQSR